MRRKMDLIQNEVRGFSLNIDKFAKICDDELENLLENIDSITTSIHKLRQKNEK